ncbi:hypothetical protein [Streptomyces hirsutus]|uniref:hypothetical protein n=1 Tax=Streptomyces hirsutus TaxID=35620 RepID=UPI003324EA14
MANQKSGCGSIFAFFGAIATGAVALAGAAYRVREFDIMEWNAWRRKRTRDGQ